MFSKIMRDFIEIVNELSSQEKNQGFSGTGLILYEQGDHFSNFHADMLNKQQKIPLLRLGDSALVTFLLEISDYRHPYHDGFHLINSDGILTNVAQFVAPPIPNVLPKISGHGARTFCAQLVSYMSSVVLTASVSSNSDTFIFQAGKLMTLAESEVFFS